MFLSASKLIPSLLKYASTYSTLHTQPLSVYAITKIITYNVIHNQQPQHNYLSSIRCKSKSSRNKATREESESERDSTEEEEITDKSSKVMNIKVGSLRLDGILKSGLGMARNKVEVMFYESNIRVNGEKVLKKSASVHVGDEIDIIKGVSAQNPKFLTVARVEVLDASPKDDYISLKIRRCKTLTIENYNDVWKPSSGSS